MRLGRRACLRENPGGAGIREIEMVGRPCWSGQLRISLVSFGIQLYPATNSSSGIPFHKLDRVSGQRVHHLNMIHVDQPEENSEIVKGYEYRKGKDRIAEPAEVKKPRAETTKADA